MRGVKNEWHDAWILENFLRYPNNVDFYNAWVNEHGDVNYNSFRFHLQSLNLRRDEAWNDDWILANYDYYPNNKLLYEDWKKFGYQRTRKDFCFHLNNTLGLCRRHLHKNDEEINWILENASSYEFTQDAANAFNKKFNHNITAHGIRDTLYSYGKTFGKHTYKKGIPSKTRSEIGHEIAVEKGVYVRTGYVTGAHIGSPKCWKLKSHYVLEQAGYEIGDKDHVIFLDGDKNNYNLDNLMVVSRSEDSSITSRKLRGKGQITKNAALQFRLQKAIENVNEAAP